MYRFTVAVLMLLSSVGMSHAERRATSPQKQPVPVMPVVLSETKTKVYRVMSINPDCSVKEIPKVRVSRRPAKGQVDILEGLDFTVFAKDHQLYQCNLKPVAMTLIYYTSAKGIKGTDNFQIEYFYTEGGTGGQVRFSVTIK